MCVPEGRDRVLEETELDAFDVGLPGLGRCHRGQTKKESENVILSLKDSTENKRVWDRSETVAPEQD